MTPPAPSMPPIAADCIIRCTVQPMCGLLGQTKTRALMADFVNALNFLLFII